MPSKKRGKYVEPDARIMSDIFRNHSNTDDGTSLAKTLLGSTNLNDIKNTREIFRNLANGPSITNMKGN